MMNILFLDNDNDYRTLLMDFLGPVADDTRTETEAGPQWTTGDYVLYQPSTYQQAKTALQEVKDNPDDWVLLISDECQINILFVIPEAEISPTEVKIINISPSEHKLLDGEIMMGKGATGRSMTDIIAEIESRRLHAEEDHIVG